ncbi:MAG TPA: F0F1 ATP synthase subunit epsilon [Candidatus Saccharimonadales bacterium]|nr:F0F1 ATP synthase subunit epsilon [Candidatus Saccharimonadales bacterium]
MSPTKDETKRQLGLSPESSSATAAEPLSIRAKVYSSAQVYFDESALSVSAINRTGPFDILPHHHNFITLLSPCDLKIRQFNGREQRIRISGGVMHVKADKVTVFLDV